MPSAQEEGRVAPHEETGFLLRLDDAAGVFDVKSHEDAGDVCTMVVSYHAALQLRQHIGRLGELVESAREDIPVHSQVRIIGADVDEKFRALSPTLLGGGMATAEILL